MMKMFTNFVSRLSRDIFLKHFFTRVPIKAKNFRLPHHQYLTNKIHRGKVLTGGVLFLSDLPHLKDDVHILESAFNDGEEAVLDLLETLRTDIIASSKEYRHFLYQQALVISEASEAGLTPNNWDELLKYRTGADEMSDKLFDSIAMLKTIGGLIKNHAHLIVSENLRELNVIKEKYLEFEQLIQLEVNKNKEAERRLLAITQSIITK